MTINKTFWTPRFPLESHQLRIYLEPTDNVGTVVLEPVVDECGYNASSSITGYQLQRFAVAQNIIYDDLVLLNPVYETFDDRNIYKTEIMTQVEVNRQGFGLYTSRLSSLLAISHSPSAHICNALDQRS